MSDRRRMKRFFNQVRKRFGTLLKRQQPIPCYLSVEIGRVPPGYVRHLVFDYWHPKGTPRP